MRTNLQRGFTLIELMVVVTVLTILAAVAVPAYNGYVLRSRVPAGLDALSTYAIRMEQRFQDTGLYGADNCGIAVPAAPNFTVTCALSNGGRGYTATATGTGPLAGYTFTINHEGTRATTAHPKGLPTGSCWSLKGGVCDA